MAINKLVSKFKAKTVRGDSLVRLDFFFLSFHAEIAIIVQQSKSLSQAIKNGLWLFFLPRCCLVGILGRGS